MAFVNQLASRNCRILHSRVQFKHISRCESIRIDTYKCQHHVTGRLGTPDAIVRPVFVAQYVGFVCATRGSFETMEGMLPSHDTKRMLLTRTLRELTFEEELETEKDYAYFGGLSLFLHLNIALQREKKTTIVARRLAGYHNRLTSASLKAVKANLCSPPSCRDDKNHVIRCTTDPAPRASLFELWLC